jgi:flagellar basal-body rod protein FlgC
MVSAIGSALSGLAAATQRINVSANNIANSESTLTIKDGVTLKEPYVPQKLVQLSQAEGGVTTDVQPVSPATVQRFDPNNAATDANGITAYPNVDTAQQLVETQLSLYNAQANINVLKVQDKLFKSVINIIS